MLLNPWTPESEQTFEIKTPAAPWAYAAALPLEYATRTDLTIVGVRIRIDLEVVSGSAGIFASGPGADSPLSQEVVQPVTSGRTTIQIDAASGASQLCIRSGPEGAALLRVHGLQARPRWRFDISDVIDELLPVMLRAGPALAVTAATLSLQLGRRVTPDDIGALQCRRAPIELPLARLWTDPLGQVVEDCTERLVALMHTYDPAKMDPRSGYLGRDFFTVYLRQSIIRVYQLIEQLRALGATGGTILEVGSLFGQFALPLQQLGYQVTVIDRYRAYGGAFDGYVACLRNCGVRVVETDRMHEAVTLGALGQFDSVICMAVIEHVPHTPRELVYALASHVRPGGVLVLDTPNIARYWNRKRLANGLSIHQALENQFFSDIPYEGHHREYTAAEMAWILEQAGCRDVRTKLFDYNLLQFRELSREHIDALLAITIDPTLADIVLAAGIVEGHCQSRQ